MKIGILSMQRVYNYGSFMQSYALKKTIESLGHDCVFIDIKPGKKLAVMQKTRSKKIIKLLKKIDIHLFKRLHHYSQMKKFNEIFKNILNDELDVNKINCDEFCDTLVIGSDEVFNCVQVEKGFDFSPHLFGQDANSNKVISYAASFGHTTIKDLEFYNISQDVAHYLKNFSAISVRDKNSKNIVHQLSGISPFENVDPVIIGEFDDRITKPNMSDYIAIYAYSNRIKDKDEIKAIKAFAKKTGKKLVGVGMYQLWCDINVIGTPFDIVGYIKHADYVVTDTFHGCVFSIKYQKDFAAFVRDSNRNKLTDLLERFNLNNRLVSTPSEIEAILLTPICISSVKSCILKEQQITRDYLSENL